VAAGTPTSCEGDSCQTRSSPNEGGGGGLRPTERQQLCSLPNSAGEVSTWGWSRTNPSVHYPTGCSGRPKQHLAGWGLRPAGTGGDRRRAGLTSGGGADGRGTSQGHRRGRPTSKGHHSRTGARVASSRRGGCRQGHRLQGTSS
jgi:hypothetical protein